MSYTIQDSVDLLNGAAELPYIVGTTVNAAIADAWPMLGPAVPTPARKIIFWTSVSSYIRIIGYAVTLAQASGKVGAGLPPQMTLVANHVYEIECDCIAIYYQEIGGGNGTLHFTAIA